VSLALLLALVLAPAPGRVELERATWDGLRAASPAELPVPAWAASRVVELRPVAGGVQLRARWTLRALTPGAWFSGQVLGDIPGMRVEDLRWDGKPAAAAVGGDGVTVAGKVAGRATIELVAFVPGDPLRAPLTLRLLPATRGRAEVEAPEGLVAALALPAGPDEATAGALLRPDAAFWSGAGALELRYTSPPAPARGATAVVVARAGLGVTVGDAELRGRGRLVWELRRGAIEAVAFRAEGVGADLEVTGAGVRAVERSGELVQVRLQAPVSGRLELELRWSAPIGAAAESRAALPRIAFEDVFRGESALQLARDGEVEAVPELRGWAPVRAAALPGWAQGLVEGTPSAAFVASGAAASAGALTLLRFVPLAGPPVVVDVAAYTIATSREGRALIRAHYEVRNERAASLRIRPPPGFEILGVRVAGETAVIARDHEGAWRVPLQRSVDTVAGLLSFPVEVALLGAAAPWARRERRALPLPRLDAPVAVSRVTLHLPPGYRSRLQAGDGEVVAQFTKGEGITYGLGVGEVGAAQADALFQGAVRRWLANDFAGAQAELDQLRSMGARNENITRLQGNLDLIAGRGGRQDAGVQRRIREQAKARAVAEQVALEALQKQAEVSRASGDYGQAQQHYQAALAVGDRLAQLEQDESVEQRARNEALQLELRSTVEEAERAAVTRKAARRRPAKVGRREDKAKFKSASVYDLGDDDAVGLSDADGADGDEPAPAATLPARSDEPARVEPAADEPAPVEPAADEPAPVVTTGRDFTAVVEVSPTATSDASGVRLAGSSGVESRYEVDGANVRPDGGRVITTQRISGRAAGGVVRRRAVRRGPRPVMSTPAPPEDARRDKETADHKRAAAEPGLPAPQVSASALSVVVPTVGAPVRYQRLLLPADAAYAVELWAREPLISRD